jgi:hypothetical protein
MKKIHQNSRLSYKEIKPKIGKRQQTIMDVILGTRRLLTDRQIMGQLGYSDPNLVRPRITELLRKGIITEGTPIKCVTTGRLVRRVKR